MAKNMYKRGSVWRLNAVVNKRRLPSVNLGADQAVASKRAKQMIEAAKREKWDVLDGLKSRGPAVPTLGEHVDEYRKEAMARYVRNRTPKPETVEAYISSLRSVLRIACGISDESWRDQPITILTKDVAFRYADAVVSPGMTEDQRTTFRRTAYSTLNQCRILWPKAIRFQLPKSLQEFLYARPVDKQDAGHKSHSPELRQATMDAARALKEEDPNLYCAFLLCYYFAMRRREAEHAKKSWLRPAQNNDRTIYWMDIGKDDFMPKGKRYRSVPVGESVGRELMSVWATDGDYILSGHTPTARRELVHRKLCAWLRKVGWSRAEWPRPVKELRAMMGAEWYSNRRIGPQWCREYLGHRDLKTTLDHYAYLNTHPDPIEIE